MFKMSSKVSLLAVVMVLTAVYEIPVAQAEGVFDFVLKAVPNVAKCSIDVWNHADQSVTVVMDSEREVRDIAPHSKATFTANFGDMPTFHFNKLGTRLEIGSKKVGAPGNSTITWNG